jgi:hypothetical protein
MLLRQQLGRLRLQRLQSLLHNSVRQQRALLAAHAMEEQHQQRVPLPPPPPPPPRLPLHSLPPHAPLPPQPAAHQRCCTVAPSPCLLACLAVAVQCAPLRWSSPLYPPPWSMHHLHQHHHHHQQHMHRILQVTALHKVLLLVVLARGPCPLAHHVILARHPQQQQQVVPPLLPPPHQHQVLRQVLRQAHTTAWLPPDQLSAALQGCWTLQRRLKRRWLEQAVWQQH